MRPQFSIFFMTFLFCYKEVRAWRHFHLGRSSGGNLGHPAPDGRLRDVNQMSTKWFTQILDHSNPRNNVTWQQKYFVNDAYFKKGGPIFLMIGGEGEAAIGWMNRGSWIDYAKQLNALLFQLEHRYYGQSRPTKDLSTKNLVYLTSEQALSDLANFITAMNVEYQLTGKWIAFGGSYPGSLAAWFRMKYPHLVHGAMSASGPLLAKLDFVEYYKVVDESLASYDENCLSSIKTGNEQIKKLMETETGLKNLNKLFKLCDPLESLIGNSNHLSNFWDDLAGNFAGVVQYNKDNRIAKSKAGNITIDIVCDIMMNKKIGTPVQRLAAVNSLLLDAYNETCLDYNYDNMIKELRNVTWLGDGMRQWMYQTCTEFGFYQTSSYSPHVFGDQFPVRFYIQQCRDIFDSQFDANFIQKSIDRSNINYGALHIDVKNVVFVHGSIDPWHPLGITKTLKRDTPAIYIKGTAHCANMYPKSDSDPPQLNQARVEIQNLISKWLQLC